MSALLSCEPVEAECCRILHLEDSCLDAEMVTAHLERAGIACKIHFADSQAAYAAALQEGNFDLILADYMIPGFGGLEALAIARQALPGVPFIFVSGTLGEEAAVEAVRQGATDYVTKQRLSRLPIAIKRALDETSARAKQNETLAALRESEARLRLALDAGRLGAWELDLRSLALQVSATCLANFGYPPESPFSYDDLRAAIHPDDRPRMEAAVAHSIAQQADYDIEYRVVWPDGSVRWMQVRGRPVYATDGTPLCMAGVSLDVTERRLAEERQALLSREVDHRAKNALAVVQATLRLTKAGDIASYIRAVEGRVGALVRAQTVLAEDRWAGASLRTLLKGELAPFLGEVEARAALDGPPISVPATAAQPLAMAVHELATNAVKYGALSVAEGRISISWCIERGVTGSALLRLRWMEEQGPPVLNVPKRRGFGWRVLDGTVRGQLGGRIALAWEAAGLVCNIEVPLRRVLEQRGRSIQDGAVRL